MSHAETASSAAFAWKHVLAGLLVMAGFAFGYIACATIGRRVVEDDSLFAWPALQFVATSLLLFGSAGFLWKARLRMTLLLAFLAIVAALVGSPDH